MTAGGKLAASLKEGRFTITAEYLPPRSGDPEELKKGISAFKDLVTAVKVPDNMGARVSAASWAVCRLLLDDGIEPIMTLVTRDRNRIALQSDMIGAAALGIQNIFCTSGEHQRFGDHPQALNVYDIDSVQLIATAKKLGNEGRMINDVECNMPVPFLIGAYTSIRTPIDLNLIRLQQKIDAGADFLQTEPVFDPDFFEAWFNSVNQAGLAKRCAVIPTVVPVSSAVVGGRTALNPAIPDALKERIKSTPESNQASEAIKICVEQIKFLKKLGVQGIHLLTSGWEQSVGQILSDAGLA